MTETSLFPDGESPTPGASLCVTIDLDDESSVLELIYSNTEGIYVRDGGEWTLVDTENEDQPTIDDQEWFDVQPSFIEVYDDLMQSSDGIAREDVVPYGSAAA